MQETNLLNVNVYLYRLRDIEAKKMDWDSKF